MTSKLDHLEGLRGVCCAIVVIDHCFNHFGPWLRHNGADAPLAQKLLANTPLNLVYSGIPAVYIFFLMSGYVLSLGFFRAQDQYLESALIKRIPRLVLPCIGAALFFFVCHLITKLTGNSIPGTKFFDLMSEAAWQAPALGIVNHNGPLWTISWELYGSFLVFAMLACFGKRHYFGWICLAAIIWFFNTNYLPFMIGMTSCYLTQQTGWRERIASYEHWKNAAFFVALALSLFLMSYPYQRDGVVRPEHIAAISWSGEWMLDYRNNVMIGAILFYLVFMAWEPLRARFTGGTVVFLGKISFSAYLLHIPLIWLTDIIFSPITPDTISGFLVKTTLVLGSTLICAIMFERYVDRPAISISSRLAKRIVQRTAPNSIYQSAQTASMSCEPLATSIPAAPPR